MVKAQVAGVKKRKAVLVPAVHDPAKEAPAMDVAFETILGEQKQIMNARVESYRTQISPPYVVCGIGIVKELPKVRHSHDPMMNKVYWYNKH